MKVSITQRVLLSALTLSCAFVASAVTLSVDKVQQRYPWNGLVDIDYTIAFADGEAPIDPVKERLVFSLVDESVSPATTNGIYNLNDCAPVPTTAGTYRVTWNANADGVTNFSNAARVERALCRWAPKYLIVDLHHGTATNAFDVSYMDAPPAGVGFNTEEYKGDKMVFRLIPPGSFVMGSPSDQYARSTRGWEDQHNVTLTKPFYIAVFELTQKQYEYLMGVGTKNFAYKGPYRPADTLSYSMLRQSQMWPDDKSIPDYAILGVLRKKTGLAFDLPTDAQWEYACRAGSTGAFYTGTPAAANVSTWEQFVKDIGRFSSNRNDKRCGDDDDGNTAIVGSYEPNAWGLYDMHGNICEIVTDWIYDDIVGLGQKKDPVGPPPPGNIIKRGGYFSTSPIYSSASAKASDHYADARDYQGARFALTVE